MYHSFGFIRDQPAIAGFFLFNDIWQPVDHVIKWVMQISSRRNEYGAGIVPTITVLIQINSRLSWAIKMTLLVHLSNCK